MYFRRISALREYNDLTQVRMGKICKVSRVTISQWETGKEVIPLRKLNAYANYFDVSIDYILGLSNVKRYKLDSTELDKTLIGKRLRKFRKENEITQKDLASLLNTTHSTISAYENGKTLILTSFIYQIAKNYNIYADWLCCRID